MRYTEEKNPDLRTVPAGQLWVGIIAAPEPHIGIATQLDDGGRIMVSRLNSRDALEIADELVRLARKLAAQNN